MESIGKAEEEGREREQDRIQWKNSDSKTDLIQAEEEKVLRESLSSKKDKRKRRM